jgi:pSer/pThr/pTyr-binding forkhead associated (FHA) protein
MVQLSILSGPRSGEIVLPPHYPFRIGRADESDLRLDQPGVWPRHLSLDIRWTDGVWIKSEPNALTSVNGHRVGQARLRNGDLIEAGSVRFRMGIKPVHQRGLKWRETSFWLAMAGLWIGQGYLIWRLLP